MKYYTVTHYVLITICTLILSACSGSGSGPQVETNNVAAADDSTGTADGSPGTISISLTSPASGENMETPDESVILEGTAESSYEIVSVSWANDRGGEGETSGTDSWKTGGIPLEMGDNSITITAEDSAGTTATRTVVVNRESGDAGSVTLAWKAPSNRADGSPLTDLAGYRIQYGRLSETYDYEIEIDNPTVDSYVVDGLDSGTWYFAATAYDSGGIESVFTDEVSTDVP
ncbi:MAG: hypothetical protein WD795_05445 [Woeseia sp.]